MVPFDDVTNLLGSAQLLRSKVTNGCRSCWEGPFSVP